MVRPQRYCLFTATAAVAQPITGALLARAAGWELTDGWIVLSIALYLFVGACWRSVVWIQARMHDLARAAEAAGTSLPPRYHRLFRIWFALGIPAFAAVLGIQWLMVARLSLALLMARTVLSLKCFAHTESFMVTEANLSRLARSSPRCVSAVGVAAAITACTPRTTSDRACPIGNLALTALKDQDHFDRYHEGIDAPMAELFRQASPRSCALVVVAQNRIATINHYGVPLDLSNENLDADAIADAAERVIRARLYVGSISKTVTALAAMKLNEEAVTGGITTGPPVALIDRPLVELFPPVSEVPDWADFTIEDYLAHKSGAPHDPDIDDSALDGLPAYLGPHPGIHPRWAFAVYKDTADPIQGFEPGDTARYSNTGYALVGAAIDWQTVSTPASAEVGYEKYVFKKIALADGKTTDPTMLSMCLGTPWRAPYMDNLAIGYDTDSTTPLAPQNFSGWEGPAGGWTMTIGDLGRLMIAMNTDKRISAGSLTTMLNFYSESELLGIDTKWGLGMWRSLEAGGRMVYGKGGNATGFTSDFVMYRGDGVGAAIVCNQHGVDHLNMRIALRTIMNACVGAGTKPPYCAPP